MNCPNCGAPLEAGALFCSVCGAKAEQPAAQSAPQRRFCTVCGRELRPIDKFCTRCGAPAGGAQQQYYAPPAVPAQPKKKRKLALPIIAVVLVVALLFTGFVAPGFFMKKSGGAESRINRVQVFLPNPTGPEAVVRITGDIALRYYVQARLYLEKLSQYDVKHLDEEEFGELVTNTLTALEDAEKISACLSEAVDLWMECDDVPGEASYKVVRTAGSGSTGLLGIKAHAAEPSPSEIKAQDIIAAFDKAKNGEKIKAVADLLNTDVKHAAVQLRMALAGEEKLAYDKIAEQATTCIRVAKTLKTAGTVAGVVIAAAPIATGAVAAMGAGEMLATGTGVVVSAVNAGLEVTSTGAMLYHGTDENEVSQMADAISDSKFMQTVNAVTSIVGVGYNIKNAFNEIEKLAKAGAGAKEITDFLSTLNKGNSPQDVFGLLSFGLSNLDSLPGLHGQLIKNDVKSLITLVTHTNSDGVTIDISDTVIGDGKEQLEAVNILLDELGMTGKDTKSVLEQAVGLYRGETTDGELPTDPEEPMPVSVIDDLLSDLSYISPDGGRADLDGLIETIGSFMTELAVAGGGSTSTEATPEPTQEPKPTSEPAPSPSPTAGPQTIPGSSLTLEDIIGYYDLTGTQTDYIDGKAEVESYTHHCRFELDAQGRLLYVTGYGEYRSEVVMAHDEASDTWTYEDPWGGWFTEYGTLTFSRENGGIRLDMQIRQVDNDYDTLESKWDLSGMKD